MKQWELKSRSRTCTVCEVAFEPGQPYHTLLPLADKTAERKDHCLRCWKELPTPQPGEGFAYWQGRFRRLTPPRQNQGISRDIVDRLLQRYLDSTDPAQRNLCYILSLQQERKKVFLLRDRVQDDQGGSVLIYEHAQTGQIYRIWDPGLTLAEVEAVQEQVRELIEAEQQRPDPEAEEENAAEDNPEG